MTTLNQTCLKSPFYSLLAFFIIISNANSQSQLYDQEHAVLLKIKQYLKNPSFLSHWISSNSSHCSWPEITCINGSITGLALVNTDINQTIPTSLCDLTNLTHVDFNLNYIPGEFPIYLYNCSKLQYLDLSMNNFVGKIPDDIDSLSNLQYLNLSYTNFTGDIPSSIGRLKELRHLPLQYCLFNGTYPDEIGNLSNLETLDLSSNYELPSSKLPLSWTKLNKLKVFYMYGCNLVGEIPENIGEMAALEKLDISQNSLTGHIPSGLFMLKNLSILYLFQNILSGEIPGVVEAFNLTIVDLTNNDLTGKIPDDFGKLQKLTGLSLSLNKLSGEIPESLGLLPSLIDFRVFFNNLSGTLPPDFGRSSNLGSFDIASNNLSGKLPENLCYYGELLKLTAYDNNLSGELPESLGNCSSLLDLKLDNNRFSGAIPSGLWTSFSLMNFMVSHNKFTGVLPERLSSNISRFEISYNNFFGRIPAGVSSWTGVVVFDASKNFFNGSIPQELTILPKLTTLLLDQNQLIGPLPSEIVSWKSLVTLNLSRNQLSGQIPDAIGQLHVLNLLDLSENEFSGQVPSRFRRLTNLNLSSNNLTGKVPSEFENSAYASSFLDNPGLCADTQALNLTPCNSSTPESSSKDSSRSLALIISLVVVAFLLICSMSFLIIRLCRKRKQGLDNSWKLISFQRLNFTESNIVSSMTEHNIIGSGGYGTVYRVAVDGLGYVAVKKIMNNKKLEKKLESSFHAEVKVLSNIRHNNIVKLLCCISNEESMLLVYEYLENRSLDRWLYKKSKSTSNVSGSVNHFVLDWRKRLRIAIGVAQGLSYMHHDCSTPIVHRDVKTSNIILDSQFNAKVADFGLARMLIKPGELETMSNVVGSFGYIAPEYVQTTRVSEKIDVFSFGVILLELTTGKKANKGDEHSSLAEWALHQVQVGSNIEELLDKEVKEPSYLDEMCNVFKLGIMCTSTFPSNRPSMKEALQVLLRCGESLSNGERNICHYDVVPLLRDSKRECRLDVENDS
ncbi:hypothetical protein TanjilG_04498 [Lupinus angustifolius]|uniref:Protein kinase domain-containing protein n=1 Tax=Lupinus angustifolius TaxID=3871 RepID=A0A4P1RQN2_LUPAN|nr:PREDICTED: receptor-like protein kinase HSL1 [Lupinus angustifolius]OIW15963.1 hypothetical protein TanjilG_04498 [Lupinus angustifolius]